MYANLKQWINVPVEIKPYLKRSATGDKVFGTSISELCYPVGEVMLVRNAFGAEVVSHNQLYVNGEVTVSELDNIVFDGLDMPVQKVVTHWRAGVPDLKVVYV